MKLTISLMLTAMMQPVVGQGEDYTDGFELVGNKGLCLGNGVGMSDIGGTMATQDNCFEECSKHEWCLGISSWYQGAGNTWCELDTSSNISCMDPPVSDSMPGFTARWYRTLQQFDYLYECVGINVTICKV